MLRAEKSQLGNNCVPKARLRTQKGATEETVGRHHPLSGHEFELLEIVADRKAWCFSLMGLHRVGHNLATKNNNEQNRHKDTFNHCNKESDKSDSIFLCDCWQLSRPLPFWPTSEQTDEDGPLLLPWLWQDIQPRKTPTVWENCPPAPIPNTINSKPATFPAPSRHCWTCWEPVLPTPESHMLWVINLFMSS